ncbi:MAG: hypothetical protein K2Y20_12555 [Sphingomonas sp.]|nr:hypothetical protein [Sphingomonas sp.]
MTIEANGPGVVTLGPDDRARAVAAVKAALELSLDDHDDLLAALAETALGLAEQFLGQMLIARVVVVTLPVRSGWQRLALAPVTAIGDVAGVAADGGAVALPVHGYDIDIVRGEGWVRLRDVGAAVRVTASVTAGAAAGWDAIPAAIRQGAVLLAAYLFSERDTTRPPPGAITALWRPFRTLTLTGSVHA